MTTGSAQKLLLNSDSIKSECEVLLLSIWKCLCRGRPGFGSYAQGVSPNHWLIHHGFGRKISGYYPHIQNIYNPLTFCYWVYSYTVAGKQLKILWLLSIFFIFVLRLQVQIGGCASGPAGRPAPLVHRPTPQRPAPYPQLGRLSGANLSGPS